MEELFHDNDELKFSNMTNGKLCNAIISLMAVEKVSRTAAYNLLVAAKTCGVRKAYSMMTTPLVLVDVTSEEDTVKMLTIRTSNADLLLCSIARFRVDHLHNLNKILPKREVHIGSVENLLNKERAPVQLSRVTVF